MPGRSTAKRRSGPRPAPRRPIPAADRALYRLFDDDPLQLPVEQWVARNLELYGELRRRGLIDPRIVSERAHRFLTENLIGEHNTAATDPQNAGHVRAQNENVLHFALAIDLDPPTLTICLEAGFIHDLNKAPSEPLRRDAFAVRDAAGKIVTKIDSVAEVVGLNHLGERTRKTLEDATRLGRGRLDEETGAAIDRCIVHHGLGSSWFIQKLLDGDNAWWGEEFVDPETGVRRLIHPPPPPWSRVSLIHDLADSIQQMQAGAAWLVKYPEGFWRNSGRSLGEMLSGPPDGSSTGIPMSLRQQVFVETSTCRAIIAEGLQRALVTDAEAQALEAALVRAANHSSDWVDDDEASLADPNGKSIYHDVARALGISSEAAKKRLTRLRVDSEAYGVDRELIHASARRVDIRRANELAARVSDATR